jgi:glutaredoxin-related protein
VDPKKVADIMN